VVVEVVLAEVEMVAVTIAVAATEATVTAVLSGSTDVTGCVATGHTHTHTHTDSSKDDFLATTTSGPPETNSACPLATENKAPDVQGSTFTHIWCRCYKYVIQ